MGFITGVALLFTLVSCLPMGGSYYEPSSNSPGGVVGDTVGAAGKKGQFTINRAGVKVIVSGFGVSAVKTVSGSIQNESPVLTIDFYVPETETVRLSLDKFRAVNSTDHSVIPIRILYVSSVDADDFRKGVTLTSGVFAGNRYPIPWLNGHPTDYGIAIKFPDNLPSSFDFYLPEMEVNDVHCAGVVIRYQKVKGVWIQDLM